MRAYHAKMQMDALLPILSIIGLAQARDPPLRQSRIAKRYIFSNQKLEMLNKEIMASQSGLQSPTEGVFIGKYMGHKPMVFPSN